jgi:hypothetical protein
VYRSIKVGSKIVLRRLEKDLDKLINSSIIQRELTIFFADEKMTVKKFESFSDFENSDHYPIMAKLALE